MTETTNPRAPDVRGKRVLVYSLGMEGRDLARWLVRNGAQVTVSDTRTEAQLQAAGAEVPEGVERLVSGQPLLDAAGFDFVAVSQSILRHDPAMVRVRELGLPFVSQMQLFLRLCPAPVIGITGSNGKSTTTSLVALMAERAGVPHVVGGNLGEALLGRLEEIQPEMTVVLEISHSQLQYTDVSPRLAAVTNVTPNHLDQFGWPEYVGLKRNLLLNQTASDIAVLNGDDETTRTFIADVRGTLHLASLRGPLPGPGAWLDGDAVYVRSAGGRPRRLLARGDVRLRGEHNLANVVMACAIGAAAAWPDEALAAAVREFRGVQHRLEVVGTASGATWINDSIATSPERTMAGLQAFKEPVVLILGGREKKLPLEGLRELAAERCRAVVCFGEAGDLFCDAVSGVVRQTMRVQTLDEAVEEAARVAGPGDVVLLSPAGTSFDAYPSFEARGAAFRQLVRALPGFEEVQR